MEISEQEYQELCRIKENKKEVWCWTKFWIGKLNNPFWAFLISTGVLVYSLITNKFHVIIGSVWGISVLVFSLDKALKIAVSKANISANFQAGANITKNINA
jgi:hypothetical protein